MWLKVGLIVLILVGIIDPNSSRVVDLVDNDIASVADEVAAMRNTVDEMKKAMAAFGRQTLLQQLFVEERIRSDGDSGVKQVRHIVDGTRNYYSATHTGNSVASIHDHSNNIRTVGMGEFIAVLNGVEFRTRHNDYRLNMPHRNSKEWHAIKDVLFPRVPQAVLDKNTVEEQTEEMRLWFKAWKDQDYTVRDYRKHFKPVLCYLEGAWTTATEGEIEEPFVSDRHFVDAKSWFDLQEKVRFTSYSGRKDNSENFSYLPTTIMNVTSEGFPQLAQWNYRILCHPLSRDLPLNRLRVVDELGSQLSFQRSFEEHSMSRAARFQINPFDTDKWTERKAGSKWSLLDTLMSEIPGKDNYLGDLTDDAFGVTAYSNNPKLKGVKLRADRYHRWFDVAKKGAMGTSTRHRGFKDANLFMAMNTQPKVEGMDLKQCSGKGDWETCTVINQKWSYAIPLEIIYMTPLSKWNPYDIEYKGDANSALGKTVGRGDRTGGFTTDTAYSGTNSKKFYQTPVEFFSGEEVGSGLEDTTRNSVGVLDKQGKLRICKASGTRIIFPGIAGVGFLRQRYPIMPIHGEGSSVWKELEAIKDLLLKSKTNGYLLHEPLSDGPIPPEPPKTGVTLQMQLARTKIDPPGPHEHEIVLTAEQVNLLKKGERLVNIRSSDFSNHFHSVNIFWSNDNFYISECDGKFTREYKCWDEHPETLLPMPDE